MTTDTQSTSSVSAPASIIADNPPAANPVPSLRDFIATALADFGGTWEPRRDLSTGLRYILLGADSNPARVELRRSDEDIITAVRPERNQHVTFSDRLDFMALWRLVEAAARDIPALPAPADPPALDMQPIEDADPLATFGDEPFSVMQLAEAAHLTKTQARSIIGKLLKEHRIKKWRIGCYIIDESPLPAESPAPVAAEPARADSTPVKVAAAPVSPEHHALLDVLRARVNATRRTLPTPAEPVTFTEIRVPLVPKQYAAWMVAPAPAPARATRAATHVPAGTLEVFMEQLEAFTNAFETGEMFDKPDLVRSAFEGAVQAAYSLYAVLVPNAPLRCPFLTTDRYISPQEM